MSRQMAFQMTGSKFAAMLEHVTSLVGKVPKDQLEAALVDKFPDKKERQQARATIIVLIKLYDTKRDYADIRNVIVWRNPDGEPGEIQIEFAR